MLGRHDKKGAHKIGSIKIIDTIMVELHKIEPFVYIYIYIMAEKLLQIP